MEDFDFGSILDEIENNEPSVWEEEELRMTIVKTNVGLTSQNKLPKLGICWKALEGPHAGEVKWENLNINNANKTSREIFVKTLLSLGLTKEFLRSLATPVTEETMQEIGDMLPGIEAVVHYYVEAWKTDPSKKSDRFKVVRLITGDESVSDSSDEESDLFK